MRPEASLGELLASVARLVSETVGFGTIAVDLYRPAWDDFEVFVVHGPEDARAALLGRRRERSFLEGLLLPQYERRGTYLVPHERRPRRRFSYVPRIEPGDGALLVLLEARPGPQYHFASVSLPGLDDQAVVVVLSRAAGAIPAPRAGGSGFGLVGMRERVRMLGGRLDAGPTARGGYALTARLPLDLPGAP